MTTYVNDVVLDQQGIDAEVERLKPEYEKYAQSHNMKADLNQLREWARESAIERELVRQHAESLAVEQDAPAPDLQEQQKQLFKRITEDADVPSEEDVAAYYEHNKEQFQKQEQVHAAHIVKHTQDGSSDPKAFAAALNIREQINKGASFEELASQHSDCPDRAGDLGSFGRGQMVEAFDEVVFNMEPGEISDVFQTPFGYHVAKVYEKTEGGLATLAEVSKPIAEHLHTQNKSAAVNRFLDKLKAEANIREE